MKSCGICGDLVGFMNKFKCKDGYVCKSCYKKASHYYSATITHKTLSEVQQMCEENGALHNVDDFEINGRIGNYILFDEKHMKICIANNRMTKQKTKNPEIYLIKDIAKCQMISERTYTSKQLQAMIEKKDETTINALIITLTFHDKTNKEIMLINSPVRVKSYAFQKTFTFAMRIEEKITQLMEAL